jgi:hypothetical protein
MLVVAPVSSGDRMKTFQNSIHYPAELCECNLIDGTENEINNYTTTTQQNNFNRLSDTLLQTAKFCLELPYRLLLKDTCGYWSIFCKFKRVSTTFIEKLFIIKQPIKRHITDTKLPNKQNIAWCGPLQEVNFFFKVEQM